MVLFSLLVFTLCFRCVFFHFYTFFYSLSFVLSLHLGCVVLDCCSAFSVCFFLFLSRFVDLFHVLIVFITCLHVLLCTLAVVDVSPFDSFCLVYWDSYVYNHASRAPTKPITILTAPLQMMMYLITIIRGLFCFTLVTYPA